jgi:hypothetical protein
MMSPVKRRCSSISRDWAATSIAKSAERAREARKGARRFETIARTSSSAGPASPRTSSNPIWASSCCSGRRTPLPVTGTACSESSSSGAPLPAGASTERKQAVASSRNQMLTPRACRPSRRVSATADSASPASSPVFSSLATDPTRERLGVPVSERPHGETTPRPRSECASLRRCSGRRRARTSLARLRSSLTEYADG